MLGSEHTAADLVPGQPQRARLVRAAPGVSESEVRARVADLHAALHSAPYRTVQRAALTIAISLSVRHSRGRPFTAFTRTVATST